MLVIQNKPEEKYLPDYLEAFYNFYNELYGYTRVGSYPMFTMDITKLPKKDQLDHNLIQSVESINRISENDNIYLFSLIDDETEELTAFSRFRISKDELLIAEIICLNPSPEKKSVTYQFVLECLESYAQSNFLKLSFVEVPFFDKVLAKTAKNIGYQFHQEYNGNLRNYRTYLLDKEITKERVDTYGRNRSNK